MDNSFNAEWQKLNERERNATDPAELLKISAERAVLCGVPKDRVLWTVEDIDRYFMGEDS